MKSLTRSLTKVLQRVHRNEQGAVSLETILIIGAIALPILIFILKYGWPKIREYFAANVDILGAETKKLTSGQ